jgi:hypothetical protein
MSKWIFFVGKPYPRAYQLPAFGDYKLGVLLDRNIKLSNHTSYDQIIEVDFSSRKTITEGLAGLSIRIDGLVCTYENYILAKSQIAEILKLPSLSIISAEASTDKLLMRQAFQSYDPSITPRFGVVKSRDEAKTLAASFSYPLIIKPTNLVKSLLVLKCSSESELLHNFDYAQKKIANLYQKYNVYDRQPQLILEEYVEGKTCSIAAFVDKAGKPHFCEGLVSLTNAQDINIDDNYIYGRFLPGYFDENLQKKLFETASKGITALGMSSTPAHVELVYNDREVKLIEIGARIGGYRPQMYSMSYGLDLVAQELKLALGQTPVLEAEFKSYCAVFELFPKLTGEFIGIDGADDESIFSRYSIKAKLGKKIGPAKNGYKAAAIIIVSDVDKQIFSRSCDKVASLRVLTK